MSLRLGNAHEIKSGARLPAHEVGEPEGDYRELEFSSQSNSAVKMKHLASSNATRLGHTLLWSFCDYQEKASRLGCGGSRVGWRGLMILLKERRDVTDLSRNRPSVMGLHRYLNFLQKGLALHCHTGLCGRESELADHLIGDHQSARE